MKFELEIVKFNVADVITTSGESSGGGLGETCLRPGANVTN